MKPARVRKFVFVAANTVKLGRFVMDRITHCKKFIDKMLQQKPEKKSYENLLGLLPFFKPYKLYVVFALVSLAVTALMILFFGKAIKYLIDFGFVQQNAFFLNISLAIFVAAVLIMAVAGYYRSSLTNGVAERVIADLRKKSYDHVIRVSAEFFETSKAGDVISRLTLDTLVLYNVISNSCSFFLRNMLFFIGGIGFHII